MDTKQSNKLCILNVDSSKKKSVFNIDNNKNVVSDNKNAVFLDQISILKYLLEDHGTLKTGVMLLLSLEQITFFNIFKQNCIYLNCILFILIYLIK